MISRRWDLGIGEDDWVVVIYQDHKMDYGNQGIYSARLGIVLGIKKGICRRLRKFQIGTQWRWSPQIIKTELWIFPGCIFDSESLFSFLYILEIDLRYQGFGAWILWFLWGLKSESIKSQRKIW
ncbi:hypothetical protein IGI04_029975 [Brassica rapa subsp. trilocularis]|uniref:Uncharacterized protein n=1 Tax=Brassica rapa subsp. trilocularis TaxID=1813537 RepID=A0ABQ7LPH2_BRACM|nr:hypothetical protein IGI04_029975 [Brassica rapa subsp. trilocularis]